MVVDDFVDDRRLNLGSGRQAKYGDLGFGLNELKNIRTIFMLLVDLIVIYGGLALEMCGGF